MKIALSFSVYSLFQQQFERDFQWLDFRLLLEDGNNLKLENDNFILLNI